VAHNHHSQRLGVRKTWAAPVPFYRAPECCPILIGCQGSKRHRRPVTGWEGCASKAQSTRLCAFASAGRGPQRNNLPRCNQTSCFPKQRMTLRSAHRPPVTICLWSATSQFLHQMLPLEINLPRGHRNRRDAPDWTYLLQIERVASHDRLGQHSGQVEIDSSPRLRVGPKSEELRMELVPTSPSA
jgi:hypothetical protein